MPGRSPNFDEQQLREAAALSFSWKETLVRLGYSPTGGNPATIKKYVALWNIDVSHFDPDRRRHRGLRKGRIPLPEVLVEGSTYSRGHLKERLYEEGLKERSCELCGQGELWRGERMALILDHINGVGNDNRLENLRIVCPNCAATLPTHCGRGLRKPRVTVICEGCSRSFTRKYKKQRFCSRECGQRSGIIGGAKGVARPAMRKVERPPYEQLRAEVEARGYSSVGRKYGVAESTVRKWIRIYQQEFGVE